MGFEGRKRLEFVAEQHVLEREAEREILSAKRLEAVSESEESKS